MRKNSFWLLFVAACSSTPVAQMETPAPDTTAPWLDVRSPLRGTVQSGDASTVEVRGYVSDDLSKGTRLFINGRQTAIGVDGTFSATVPLTAGITLIHAVATDSAGNQARDTRAVLSGDLVSIRKPVTNGVVARLDARAVRAGGQALAKKLGTSAFEAATVRLNPLVNDPIPCWGARADVSTFRHGAIKLLVTPVGGGLLVDADVPDLAVAMQVRYNDTCTTSKTSAATAKARHFFLRGLITLNITKDGTVSVDDSAASAEMERFDLDGGSVSGDIAERLAVELEDTLTPLIRRELASRVPAAILSGLGSIDDRTVAMGDQKVVLTLKPTELTFDSKGVTLAVDSEMTVKGGGDAEFLPSASPRPVLDARNEIAVGLADDELNQLLSAFWGAGAFDRTLDATGGGVGGLFDELQVFARLAPMVTALPAGDGIDIVIGDVDLVYLRHGVNGDEVVARGSASADITASIHVVDGKVTLRAVTNQLYLDQTRQSYADTHVFSALSTPRVESFVRDRLVTLVGDALSNAPLPTWNGSMTAVQASYNGLERDRGYVVVGADLPVVVPND